VSKTISGKVVLITGASSGIGAGLAREFGRLGASVVLTARREERLQALAEEIEQLGGKALPIVCDVTCDGELERAVAEAIKAFGSIDVVIANAGFGVIGSIDKLGLDDYRRQLETNLFGVLRTVIASREALLASKGTLAIIGSVSGEVAMPSASAYSISKAAIHSLVHSLWYELTPLGVGVCLIVPGFIESDIRRVDNLGRLHPESKDPIPPWLPMPTAKAAQKIIRAISKRRRRAVITAHGKLAVAIQRFMPGPFSLLVRRLTRPKSSKRRNQ
jgi:short-subunit dehydrogenase